MSLPPHDHDRMCRAVNFDADTGRYTGTRAVDPEQCPTCRREAALLPATHQTGEQQ